MTLFTMALCLMVVLSPARHWRQSCILKGYESLTFNMVRTYAPNFSSRVFPVFRPRQIASFKKVGCCIKVSQQTVLFNSTNTV
jgi:hypothetical protein